MSLLKSLYNILARLEEIFDPLAFIISLFIGIFIVYSITPPPKIIVKHPTPENSGRIIYKDEAHNCFKVLSKETECPSDTSKINSIPLKD
tara:strand:+ start:494 stop:763 length:270 start_codon:yes stop_codon:yes gene_type:complete